MVKSVGAVPIVSHSLFAERSLTRAEIEDTLPRTYAGFMEKALRDWSKELPLAD